MRISVRLALALLLWAASLPAQGEVIRNFGPNDFANYKASDRGAVLVSVAENSGGEMLIRIRKAGTSETGWINPRSATGPFGIVSQFEDKTTYPSPEALTARGLEYLKGGDSGRVLSQPLPPGSYEIYEVVVWDTNREFHFDGLNLSFEIRSGRSSYIGAFRGLVICGKSWLSRCVSQQLVLQDQSLRDIAIAKPHIEFSEVDTQVQPSDALGPPEGARGQPTPNLSPYMAQRARDAAEKAAAK